MVHEGDVELINGTWATQLSDEEISNGIISVTLYEKGKLVLIDSQSFSIMTDENGFYLLTFNYTKLPLRIIIAIPFEDVSADLIIVAVWPSS